MEGIIVPPMGGDSGGGSSDIVFLGSTTSPRESSITVNLSQYKWIYIALIGVDTNVLYASNTVPVAFFTTEEIVMARFNFANGTVGDSAVIKESDTKLRISVQNTGSSNLINKVYGIK